MNTTTHKNDQNLSNTHKKGSKYDRESQKDSTSEIKTDLKFPVDPIAQRRNHTKKYSDAQRIRHERTCRPNHDLSVSNSWRRKYTQKRDMHNKGVLKTTLK